MTPSTIHPPDAKLQTIEQAIKENIGRPDALEQLYRSDRSSFKKAFERTYVHLKEHIVAQVWQERLKTPQEETTWGQRNEWIFLAVTIFASGCILKIPSLTGINEEFFYPRNIALAVIPMLTAYFLRNQHSIQRIALPAITFLIASVYINLLPDNNKSDTLTLACIHMPIFLWTVAGSVFPSNGSDQIAKRMEFLAFNGDLLIMATILAIAGVLFSGITFGLFHLINISIDGFYADYLVIWGAPAIPILATSLIRNNPSLVNRISPVIARIFTPLVFVMLLVFLGAIAYTGKDPYNDREFLLLFNALLAGVMAIILFSVSGSGKTEQGPKSWIILFGLALLAIIANSIALSAIVFRIFEWGVTPNRVAVLGSNVFIFIHLIAVTVQLYKTVIKGAAIERANQAIAVFIPVYGAWAAFVVFVLPLLFQFK